MQKKSVELLNKLTYTAKKSTPSLSGLAAAQTKVGKAWGFWDDNMGLRHR